MTLTQATPLTPSTASFSDSHDQLCVPQRANSAFQVLHEYYYNRSDIAEMVRRLRKCGFPVPGLPNTENMKALLIPARISV